MKTKMTLLDTIDKEIRMGGVDREHIKLLLKVIVELEARVEYLEGDIRELRRNMGNGD